MGDGTETTAHLKNVAAFAVLVRKVTERDPNLPGLACFYGPSGFGKSRSAVFAMGRTRAVYAEAGQFTTARSLMQQVLRELGVASPRGGVAELAAEAVRLLRAEPRRPLIIDEAHHIAHRRFIDLVRELHDKARVPVILVGEETLPRQLEAFERVHNRVLAWEAAQPCDTDDVRALVKASCPGLVLADDLVRAIHAETRGNARRIVVRLNDVREAALHSGRAAIDLAAFGPQRLTGFRVPTPRKAA